MQSCATYIRYVRFAKFLLKNVQLLPLFEILSEEAGTGRELVISHLNSHFLYGCVEEDVMLMVEAADFFIKNPRKAFLFLAASFYKAAKLVLMYLREMYTLPCLVERACFKLS